LKFKRIVTLFLVLILASSLLCACGNNSADDPTSAPTIVPTWPTPDKNNDSTTVPTESIQETMPAIPEKTKEELREEERLRKQQVRSAQLLVYNLKSDVSITLDSDYFKDTCDMIRINTSTLESKDLPFITKLKQSGIVYIGTIDENYSYGDVIHVTPSIAAPDDLRCSLHGGNIDINIDAKSASAAAMSLFHYYVKLNNASDSFVYDVMESDYDNRYHIMINGHLEKVGDVEISRDGNIWTITSTREMQYIHVSVSGMGDDAGNNHQSADSTKPSRVYHIIVNDDGSIKIYA
jgi:hypothetical protein